MSINITQKPEQNVINVGDEITTDQLAAIQNAQSPSAANPLATVGQITNFDQSLNTTDEVEFSSVSVNSIYTVNIDSSGNLSGTWPETAGANWYLNLEEGFSYNYPDGSLGFNHSGLSSNYGGGFATISGGGSTFTIDTGSVVPVTIINKGTGNSFVVNDSFPDTTPFVINSAGRVGVGIVSPQHQLDVGGGARIATSINEMAFYVHQSSTGATMDCVVIENRGTGNSIRVHDQAATDTSSFIVNNAGDVVIGGSSVTAGFKLDVVGSAKVSQGLTVESIELGTTGIRFQAANVVKNIAPFNGAATGTYPDEVEIWVNNVKYRVPARQV
jgi:hypothetical protein